MMTDTKTGILDLEDDVAPRIWSPSISNFNSELDYLDESSVGAYPARREYRRITISSLDTVNLLRQHPAEKELKAVEASIEQSRYILDLGDNWDDEGAIAILSDTWEKATSFARSVAEWSCKYRPLVLGQLSISPLAVGSIDLYWENEFADLLVNVRPNTNLGSMYGTNRKGEILSGAVDLGDSYPELVISWLKKRRAH